MFNVSRKLRVKSAILDYIVYAMTAALLITTVFFILYWILKDKTDVNKMNKDYWTEDEYEGLVDND